MSLHISWKQGPTYPALIKGPAAGIVDGRFQGRGRPKSGPVDGNGRRSVYISIRRNFLSPMMLAFDTPQPFSTVGRRSVSNVPAQALIMMNDPLVAELANHWSKKLQSLKLSSNDQQIERLYMEVFSRPPSPRETQLAIAFLKTQARELKIPEDKIQTDQRVWSDLCHVLFNMKELVFVR